MKCSFRAPDFAGSTRHILSDDGQIFRNLSESPMTAPDFHRIALSLEEGGRYRRQRVVA